MSPDTGYLDYHPSAVYSDRKATAYRQQSLPAYGPYLIVYALGLCGFVMALYTAYTLVMSTYGAGHA